MQSQRTLFIFILFLGCLNQIASDISAPALTIIATGLNTSINNVQWSMAIYMLGVAISLLFYGPLSEAYGRKKPLLFGITLMMCGSLISSFAPTISILIIGRFIQGLGGGASAGMWRSIFRDVFSGEVMAKYASYMVIWVTFVIPAAPTLGAYLMHLFSWRAIFAFLFIYAGVIIFTILFYYEETNVHYNRKNLQFFYIKQSYKTLLTHREFLGITLAVFMTYGAFFSWFAVSPVLLIKALHMSPLTYGWLNFFGGGATFALGGYLSGKYVTRFGVPAMMRCGYTIMTTAGALMMLGYVVLGLTKLAVIIPGLLFYFGTVFIWPNAFAAALAPFGKSAGYAGSVYSFMQICGGAAIGALVAHLPDHNQLILGSLLFIAASLAWALYEVIGKPSGSQQQA